MNYLIKHWRGELPLWVSFWVNLVLINVALGFLRLWLTPSSQTTIFKTTAMTVLLYGFFEITISIWQIVGTARSTTRKIDDTKRWIVGGTVLFLLLMLAFSTIINLKNSLPIYSQMLQVIFGIDEALDVTPITENSPPKVTSPQLTIIVSKQDSEGITQDQMTQIFLSRLEKYAEDRIKAIVKSHYESSGQKAPVTDMISESNYIELDGTKLALVRVFEEGKSNSIFIHGIKDKEIVRILCASQTTDRVEITTGDCANKISEIFGVSFHGTPTAPVQSKEPISANQPTSKPVVSRNPSPPNQSLIKIDFGDGISMDVPKTWQYLDPKYHQLIQTSVDAVLKLAALPEPDGTNILLIAANANTGYKTSSATLRLSVRHGPGSTQQDVRQLANEPKKVLDETLDPALTASIKSLETQGFVSNVKSLGGRVESNSFVSCIFTELEYSKPDGVTLSQTWLCPFGDKAVKLSTSYRKSEAVLFEPVIRYVFQSLNVANVKMNKSTPKEITGYAPGDILHENEFIALGRTAILHEDKVEEDEEVLRVGEHKKKTEFQIYEIMYLVPTKSEKSTWPYTLVELNQIADDQWMIYSVSVVVDDCGEAKNPIELEKDNEEAKEANEKLIEICEIIAKGFNKQLQAVYGDTYRYYDEYGLKLGGKCGHSVDSWTGKCDYMTYPSGHWLGIALVRGGVPTRNPHSRWLGLNMQSIPRRQEGYFTLVGNGLQVDMGWLDKVTGQDRYFTRVGNKPQVILGWSDDKTARRAHELNQEYVDKKKELAVEQALKDTELFN